MTTLNKKNTKQLQSIRKKQETIKTLFDELSKEIDELQTGTGKKTTKKSTKDPNAPKRPSTAWIYFYQEQVQTMKHNKDKNKDGTMGSVLSTKWKSMSDKQKKKYKDKALADRERYAREKEEYEKKQKNNTTTTTTTTTKKSTTKQVPNNTDDLVLNNDDDLVLDNDDDFAADDLELSDDGDF